MWWEDIDSIMMKMQDHRLLIFWKPKILINSTISGAKKGARFMSCDLKDFFLASPMKESEYIKVPIKYFPPNIIAK